MAREVFGSELLSRFRSCCFGRRMLSLSLYLLQAVATGAATGVAMSAVTGTGAAAAAGMEEAVAAVVTAATRTWICCRLLLAAIGTRSRSSSRTSPSTCQQKTLTLSSPSMARY